jgi:hypothetical protein
MMKSPSINVVIAIVTDAKHLVEALQLAFDCEPFVKLSTAPFQQINIAWGFKLIIGRIGSYNCMFISYLNKYFTSHYTYHGQPFFHSSWVVEEYFYYFVMFD